MIRHIASVAALTLALGAAGCSSTPSRLDELAILTDWMTGTFDSTAQSEAAPDDYFPIRLVTVPIWTDRADGHWLYVEQAVMTATDEPYRQRVYHLTMDGNDGFRSDVFELPDDPKTFVAAWAQPELFKTCSPEDLEPRSGCTIFLRRRKDGAFAGETRGTRCRSRLGGADYATSEVVVTRDQLTSWDRGFTSDGRQVWGAEKGAYEFVRTSPGAP